MPVHELGHLEHVHLILSTEDRFQTAVSFDHPFVLLILESHTEKSFPLDGLPPGVVYIRGKTVPSTQSRNPFDFPMRKYPGSDRRLQRK